MERVTSNRKGQAGGSALGLVADLVAAVRLHAAARRLQSPAGLGTAFEDDDVAHVSGSVDPVRDIEIIDTELALADLDTVEKALDKVARQAKTGDKKVLARKALLERVRDHLDSGKPMRALELTDDEKIELRDFQFLTIKPTLYIANVDEEGFKDNPLSVR